MDGSDIHDTIKLLIDDVVPVLLAWIFMALVGDVTGTRKTHIATIFVYVFNVSSRGYYDAFATGGGREWLLSWKALPGKRRAKIFYAIHDTITLLGDEVQRPSLQVLALQASLQDT